MVSVDRSLLKGEAPRFSADFMYHLSYERPFNFPRHLVGALAIDELITMSDLNIHSAIFKLTRTRTQTGTDRDTDKDTDKDPDMDTDMDMETDLDIKFSYFFNISLWH